MLQKAFALFCLLALTEVVSDQHVESELSQLPKLFHLDDYEKCLDKEDGIYCLGQFQLYSDVDDNPTYALIQKYSQDPELYNRTYLHRGYCVSARCSGAEGSLPARFERCVDKWAKYRHGLRARLQTLSYCKEYGKPLPNAPDTQDLPHQVFLYVVLMLLALNIIGTIYDVYVVKDKGNEMLLIWSMRRNFKKLTEPDTSPVKIKFMNGLKTLLALSPVYCHASIFYTAVYQKDPRFMEKYLLRGGPMMGVLTSYTGASVTIAHYFMVQSILQSPDISFKGLPKLILRRFCRMLPVYLLMVGFAATWWRSAGDGPMWHYVVDPESAICRRKFWIMASFLQNWIDTRHICLVQTWVLAVDMQLYIPALVLVVLLKKCRRHAKSIVMVLSVAAVAYTAHLVFENGYEPFYYNMGPEHYRGFFANYKTFWEFFMTPKSCVLMSAIGILAGFYQNDIDNRKVESNNKIFKYIDVPLLLQAFLYISAYHSYYLKQITDEWWKMAMLLLEKVFTSVVIASIVLIFFNSDTPFIRFLRWPPFRYFSRISLSMAMVHWCVNGWLIGNRYQLQDSSLLGLMQDTIVTLVVSCFLAVPLTVMVDTPAQKTFDKILKYLPS